MIMIGEDVIGLSRVPTQSLNDDTICDGVVILFFWVNLALLLVVLRLYTARSKEPLANPRKLTPSTINWHLRFSHDYRASRKQYSKTSERETPKDTHKKEFEYGQLYTFSCSRNCFCPSPRKEQYCTVTTAEADTRLSEWIPKHDVNKEGMT